ncbi:MAG TPA: SoxR reducing system RseC family protein, partial [Mariprofundaceae bacterium]|nr:SoxR reducing system RseC family protein [Mariprofundaceae bacterium]
VERMVEMRVRNGVGAGVGDTVIVAVQEGVLLRAALRLYGVPMFAFFAFGLLSLRVAHLLRAATPDLWAVAGSMAGLVAAYVWVALRSRHDDRIEAAIVSIKERAQAVPIPLLRRR